MENLFGEQFIRRLPAPKAELPRDTGGDPFLEAAHRPGKNTKRRGKRRS
jgi:hypothetical protein